MSERERKVFDPHLLDDALKADLVNGLRELADAIQRGELLKVEVVVGASPLRLKPTWRNSPLQLARVTIDLGAMWGYVDEVEQKGLEQ